MKKQFYLFFLCLLYMQAWSQPRGGGWSIVFEDDFNGSSLDLSKWNEHYNGGSRYHNHQGYSVHENIRVNSGSLKLVCTPIPGNANKGYNKENDPLNFYTGVVTSSANYSFTYGYYEARIKLPQQKGVWPAFWMLSRDGGWPPEIDMLEYLWKVNDPTAETQAYCNVHWGSAWNNKTASGGWYGSNVNTGWHTYGLNWTPTKMEYYIDDVLVKTLSLQTLANTSNAGGTLYFKDFADKFKNMYIILNFGMGGTAWPGRISNNAGYTEKTFEIDYVRVYKRVMPIEDGNFILKNSATGNVADVAGASTANNAAIGNYDYNSGNNQIWNLEAVGSSNWRLVNKNSGKVLKVGGDLVSDNEPIVQYEWTGHNCQRWSFVNQYFGCYRLLNENTGKALSASGSSMFQLGWNGSSTQQWKLDYCDSAPISSSVFAGGIYLITAKHACKPLEALNASTGNSAQIVISRFDNSNNQRWRLHSSGVSGYYKIQNVNSGKLLTVRGGSDANGTVVEQNDDQNQDKNLWQIVSLGNGYYKIVNRGSGLVLDLSGAATGDNSGVVQWPYQGGENQQFCFTIVDRFGSANRSAEISEPADGITLSGPTVYPNPVVGQYFVIDLAGISSDKNVDVKIADLTGRIFYNKQAAGNSTLKIDRSKLGASGVYLVSTTIDGKVKNIKLIIR